MVLGEVALFKFGFQRFVFPVQEMLFFIIIIRIYFCWI